MAKKITDDPILNEVINHYDKGTEDNDIRRTRDNGWNHVLEAYFGKVPENWPYLSIVVDPVIRTTILEKTSRLFNGKLRGKLVPREGGDTLKAKINNAVLEYQWDNANDGGSMIEKWALMDMQTRLFGASFALVTWKTDVINGKTVFDGNEFKVLDNRDVFVDYSANHVKNANWVQVREWRQIKDLEEENENSPLPIYKDLDLLKARLSGLDKSWGGDRRDVKYESLVKRLRDLEDRVGDDPSFPVIELVTEYRRERWITFSPKYKVIIRDIPNPYQHKKIPVVQLRYYPVGDDVYGESEVEAVLPISRGINAILCGAIDEVNLRMKPPIKIANNETVRLDTIEYGPNAIWLVGNSVNNVMELQGTGDLINNFQTMYSALKQAYNNAMGEMSQGVGTSADPFSPDKTATEVRASERQKLSRDNYNQLYLEQALKDLMGLWFVNNQQFLFSDPQRAMQIIRITGRDTLKDLMEIGLHRNEIDNEGTRQIVQMITEGGGMNDTVLKGTLSAMSAPKYPILANPEEQDPMNWEFKKKLELDKNGEGGYLHIVPEDLEGMYDYIPSVQSMSINADETKKQGREKALQFMLLPQLQQQLQQNQEVVKVKELVIQILEDYGVNNAEKFFEQVNPAGAGAVGEGLQIGGADQTEGMAGPTQFNDPNGEIPVPQPAGL